MTATQALPLAPTACPTWCAGCNPDDAGHSRPLVTVELGGLDPVTVDRVGEALFYITGEGELTPEHALDLAAGLIEAVRSLTASS